VSGLRRFYFEDVVVGGELETPGMTITEAHVALYCGLTREAAPDDVVPDHLPLCLTTGLGWRVPQPPLDVQAFVGFDWRLLERVRVGDTIHSRSRTVTKRALRDGGLVIEEREVLNQRGQVVQQGRFTFLVGRRPRAGGREAAGVTAEGKEDA
jgi:acyl dehydratase